MSDRLLVDASEFWDAVAQDISQARDRVLVQALTFEGDSVGARLTQALCASRARDRRLVVDCFSKHVVSDRWLRAPWNLGDSALRAERRRTDFLCGELRKSGAAVRFVNPFGAFLRHLPARNHKKLVVIDDRVAYVGGINFSEHNFEWHDLMIRMERNDAADFLAEDFDATWQGRNLARVGEFGDLRLYALDGRSNERAFGVVLTLIEQAQRSLFVESPYFMEPFRTALSRAARRGVEVVLVTPERNNWALLGSALNWRAGGDTVDTRFYAGRMTHLKAILVDGETLVLGSANFDLLSYHFQQEYFAIFRDPELVADFARRVAAPDTANAVPARQPRCADRIASWQLAGLEHIAAVLKPRG